MKFKIGDKVKIGDEMCTIVNTFAGFECDSYDLISESGIEFTRKEIELSKYKPTLKDLQDYILENFVDEFGNLVLCELDFSEFNGDVYLAGMKVKRDLFIDNCNVGGDLNQGWQEVQGDYMCNGVKFGGEARVDKPQKLLKEITKEELEEMGYKLKEDN